MPEDGKIALKSLDLVSELRRLSGKEKAARAEFEVAGTLAERERAGEVVSSSVLAEELKAAR